MHRFYAKRILFSALIASVDFATVAVAQEKYDPTAVAAQGISKLKVKATDWPQFGGSSERNNVPDSGPLPTSFDIKSGKNIRWSSPLGSETFGFPVVANGKVY